jgi:hypothetical protein
MTHPTGLRPQKDATVPLAVVLEDVSEKWQMNVLSIEAQTISRDLEGRPGLQFG